MSRLIWIIAFLCLGFSSNAQKQVTLFFHLEKETIKNKVRLDSSGYEDEKSAAIELFKLYGYTGINQKDSIQKKGNIHYYFDAKSRFKRVNLICVNAKKERIDNQRSFGDVASNLESKLTDLENKGFPFAQVKIIDQVEEGNSMTIKYLLDSGNYFFIDKIHIKSESKIHEKTFLTMINLKVGDTYDEAKIRGIEEQLEVSPFYSLKRPAEVLFRKGKAEIYLYVNKKKSSNADGFIGFNQDPDSKKLVFNGNIDLSLRNALNRAEVLDLSWRSSPDKTQNLDGILRYPYILGSPIGIGSRIDLRKQDTSFIKSDIWIELSYLHPRFTFTVFDQIEGSSTISSVVPAGIRDYKKNTIGLQFEFRPKMPEVLRFYHPQFAATGGIYNYRADTIDDNKQKIENNKYILEYGHTFDFLKYFHLKNRLQFNGLQSSIDLSQNELIYYGGLRSVRGFYELELFGNNVWILNNEIEFQPIKALSMSLIYDYSIADNNQTKVYTNSLGVGFGLNIGNSTLEIVVANGTVNDNSFNFSNSRIHIGFRSNF